MIKHKDCSGSCKYGVDVGMPEHSCSKQCAWLSVQPDVKFIIHISGQNDEFELPVYAKSLEEAELKSQEYVDGGFIVTRIRPEV